MGLSGEVWHETREEGVGMVDSELGRIVVLPVDDKIPDPLPEDYQPLMLLSLNSTTDVEWEELKSKGRVLASHLAKPLSKFREHLAVVKPPPIATSNIASPVRLR